MLRDEDETIVIDRTAILDDGDSGFGDIIDDGGGSNPRCEWDESICTETPTHHIRWQFPQEDGEDTSNVAMYCKRHYAVELARFVHFHEPMCSVGLAAHVGSYGEI